MSLQMTQFCSFSWLSNRGFPGGSDSKESASNVGDVDSTPVLGNPLEEGMATHSSIVAGRISWTEQPGGLQSMGSQRIGHDWSDWAHSPIVHIIYRLHLPYPFLCWWTLRLLPLLSRETFKMRDFLILKKGDHQCLSGLLWRLRRKYAYSN